MISEDRLVHRLCPSSLWGMAQAQIDGFGARPDGRLEAVLKKDRTQAFDFMKIWLPTTSFHHSVC